MLRCTDTRWWSCGNSKDTIRGDNNAALETVSEVSVRKVSVAVGNCFVENNLESWPGISQEHPRRAQGYTHGPGSSAEDCTLHTIYNSHHIVFVLLVWICHSHTHTHTHTHTQIQSEESLVKLWVMIRKLGFVVLTLYAHTCRSVIILTLSWYVFWTDQVKCEHLLDRDMWT